MVHHRISVLAHIVMVVNQSDRLVRGHGIVCWLVEPIEILLPILSFEELLVSLTVEVVLRWICV